MPNGGFDPEAKYAQLGERVENQSRQIGDLDNRMGKGFSEIASVITARAASDIVVEQGGAGAVVRRLHDAAAGGHRPDRRGGHRLSPRRAGHLAARRVAWSHLDVG